MNSTTIIIYNKANDFFSSSDSKHPCGSCENYAEFKLNIPVIKKMFGFDVESYILIEKKNVVDNKYKHIFKFEIITKKLTINNSDYYKFFSYEKKMSNLNLKNTQKFVNLVKEILPQLIFNKLTGLFEFKINKNNKPINFSDTKTNNLLGIDTFGYEYSDCGECCVCYDKTLTKTSCNHFLCLECWTKIKNTTECPYCRHKKIKICLIEK